MILDKVFWRFGEKKYSNYEAFLKDAKDYNQILAPEQDWKPDEKVIDSKSIVIMYEADWRTDDYTELIVTIQARDGKALTMGEILYTIQNNSLDFFKDAECSYFQGLEAFDLEEDVPEYKMKVTE